MPSKKDLAVDALLNLHFADRAEAEAALDKLLDALEERHAERAAEMANRIDALPIDDEIVIDDAPPAPETTPAAP